ncbi:MAG: hypothetical protein ACOZBZ_01260 [Patescibacteria group bacterium]
MTEENSTNRILFLILLGVITFAAGLLGLAIIIILLSALGFLTIQ